MNHLYRELAPISDAAWEEIEKEARRTLKTTLAARKVVDFVGPQGWEASAVGIGRSNPVEPPSSGNVEARLRAFSGGNQQKVALAKWLTHAPRILLLAEPTRGMDVGAKEDVLKIVRALRDQGIAIVVFSTEPETVLSLADRVLVMRKGEVAHEFADEAISKDRLLAAA